MSAEKLTQAMELVAKMHEASTPIKGGKKYTKVVHRVEAFRKTFGLDYSIQTTIKKLSGGVLAGAAIVNDRGIIGQGHAWCSNLSKEKSLEKLETTAIGRALASIGLGGDEYASDAEIETFEERYEQTPKEEPKFTREDKMFQRDFLFDLAGCKTINEVNELHNSLFDDFQQKPGFITDPLNDQIGSKKKQIESGIKTVPHKYGFIDVEEALSFGVLAKKNIETGPVDGLENWWLENHHKITALDAMLKAKKYNEDGTPSERLDKAYQLRTKKPIAAE